MQDLQEELVCVCLSLAGPQRFRINFVARAQTTPYKRAYIGNLCPSPSRSLPRWGYFPSGQVGRSFVSWPCFKAKPLICPVPKIPFSASCFLAGPLRSLSAQVPAGICTFPFLLQHRRTEDVGHGVSNKCLTCCLLTFGRWRDCNLSVSSCACTVAFLDPDLCDRLENEGGINSFLS